MSVSPIRYAGGKSKAVKFLEQHVPQDLKEIREPFAGGASFSLYMKKKNPHIKLWLNDLYYNLYNFWLVLRDDVESLQKSLYRNKALASLGEGVNCDRHRELFHTAKSKINTDTITPFQKAVAFFILNRCSYSGLTEAGGFSKLASRDRFTESSIKRLKAFSDLLQDAKITNLDYSHLLDVTGEDEGVLLFMDPPYDIDANVLYGTKGKLHKSFDHDQFAIDVAATTHNFMITYNNNLNIKGKFDKFNIVEWNLQYSMVRENKKTKKGKEILILNY